MSAIFIGLDPSISHSGLVALDETGKLGRFAAIKTKPAKDWIGQVNRECAVVEDIQTFIEGYRRALSVESIHVVVEGYAPRFMATAIPIIEMGGLLRAMLAEITMSKVPPIAITFIAPMTLKKFATGRGNSDKITVAVALSRFGYDFGGDDNLFDAAGLARLGMALDGHCDGLNKAQIELVNKLKLSRKEP